MTTTSSVVGDNGSDVDDVIRSVAIIECSARTQLPRELDITDQAIEIKLEQQFVTWFLQYAFFTWELHMSFTIYEAWCQKAAIQYTGNIYLIAKKRRTPIYLMAKVFQHYKKTRATDETFKKKSEQMNTNKRFEVGGSGTGISLHSVGSISARKHGDTLMKWVINVDKYRKIKLCCHQSKAAEPYLEYCGVTREEVLRRFVLLEGLGSCYQASTSMG
ncbi:hypothetical protein Syun_018414 [Stephania yunnanensis]|uniref:Uncharacterized protein n=1 Tax=Stephania yunnanensis TaxID=152371 RepID=A0AAP0IU37_9MAGN